MATIDSKINDLQERGLKIISIMFKMSQEQNIPSDDKRYIELGKEIDHINYAVDALRK